MRIFGHTLHQRTHSLPSRFKILRTSSLKAEDRLFVVADHEQGPQFVAVSTFTGKEIASQCIDNPPLRRIGVLRFVNQYVIEAPVQLVADPFSQL